MRNYIWRLKRLIFASKPQSPYSYRQIFPVHLRKNSRKYQFADFVVLVRDKKSDLEKYIAMRENKLTHFNVKWKVFM